MGNCAELVNISTSTSPEKPGLFKNTFLWVGLGIGLVSTANYWLPFMTTVPWLPDLLGVDLTKLAILPWVITAFTFDPWMIGAAFLMPREWLLSYIAWCFILFWIVPTLMTAVGLLGTMPVAVSAEFVWGRFSMYGTATGNATWGQLTSAGIYGPIWSGVILSLALWPLFTVQREHLANSVRALWKKLLAEEEKEEPMPY